MRGRWVWGLPVILFACSPFHRTTKSWVEVASGDSTSIAHAPLFVPSGWNPIVPEGYDEVGTHRGEAALANQAKLELISLNAPGCFPSHHIVAARRYNAWKFADLLGIGGGITAMVAGGNASESLVGAGFFLAFGNFVALWMPPKRTFLPRYDFDALEPMPVATTASPVMELLQFDFDLKAGDHSWRYFESLKDHERDRWVGRNASREDLVLEDTNLDEVLHEVLVAQGFEAPPSQSMLRAADGWQLHGALIGLKEERLARAVRYEATTAWWVEHPFRQPVDTVVVVAPSTWHLYETGDMGLNRDALEDALIRAVLIAAEEPLILEDAESLSHADADWTARWEPLVLRPQALAPGKIGASVASIVTIEDERGHGSGCIVDSDGWILTNHHVAPDSAKRYTVTLHDGTKLEGQMVRHHPVWDLALLKVDATGLVPFAIDRTAMPELGEDVFAIGTPYDTGLGATLTRGIVSGRRVDGARTLIQTDVSISPGNSGGALARPDGTLVGIITEKVMDAGVEGLGFAMPVTDLSRLLGVHFANESN